MDVMIAALLSLCVGAVAIQLLISDRLRGLAIDLPNERSLHDRPTPRTGGIAIIMATSAGVLLQPASAPARLWAIAFCLGVVSFIDDRKGLRVGVRFVAQLCAAATAIGTIGASSEPVWWFALAVVTTAWMTNLYNFMDGSDGLAGGMAVSGFGAYALAAAMSHELALAAACTSVAAASIAFLTRNLPPAQIFMGDAGSTVLGFSAATFGIHGVVAGLWPLWFPGLVFLPFIADASVTLFRRVLQRERVWQAHRQHYYQRLIRSGWSHARMANVAYALMLGTAGSAVLALALVPSLGWPLLVSWLLLLALLMRAVDARWARYVETHDESRLVA